MSTGPKYIFKETSDIDVTGTDDDDFVKGVGFLAGAQVTIDAAAGNDTVILCDDNDGEEEENHVHYTVYGGLNGNDTESCNIDTISVTTNGEATIYGGRGEADAEDGNDVISIGGAGAFTVYANGGNDVVLGCDLEDGANATVFGGKGDDLIVLGDITAVDPAVDANLEVLGGEGSDAIFVATDGEAVIYGGTGVADPNDGADLIAIGGAGTFKVYGNGGSDILVGVGLNDGHCALGLQDGASVDAYGGAGNDILAFGSFNFGLEVVGARITELGFLIENVPDGSTIMDAVRFVLAGVEASHYDWDGNYFANTTLNLFGGEGMDVILAATSGTAQIFGGQGEVDPSDGGDLIAAGGTGVFDVYGNGGDDIVLWVGYNSDAEQKSAIHGGAGNDIVAVLGDNVNIWGNEGSDIFSVGPNFFRADVPIEDLDVDLIASIMDFTSGEDKIDVSLLLNSKPDAITTIGVQEGDLAATLKKAAQTGDEVVQFNYEGDTYLVINHEYPAAIQTASSVTSHSDVIKLVGVESISLSDFASESDIVQGATQWAENWYQGLEWAHTIV